MNSRQLSRVGSLLLGALLSVELVWAAPAPEFKFRGDTERWGQFYLPEVAPAVFARQMYQESRFKEDAKSVVGASGIFQIMPATAGDLKRTCNLPYLDVLNPRMAIQAGICYDSQLWKFVGPMKTQPDRLDLMLRCYNGGCGYIQKERKQVVAQKLDKCVASNYRSFCRMFRSLASCNENLDYPDRILVKHKNLFLNWGRG